MTKNAYIFSWDQEGIEAIIPITQYENIEKQNLMNILSEKPVVRSPLNGIIQRLVLRARFNPQRHYEIYAVDCTEEMDEKFWRKQWEEYPQETADLIRDRGHKILSDRASKKPVII
jgi:hypothetical protein